MSNELFKAFDNGSLRLPASSTEFTDLPWAKHPVFEGVELKHNANCAAKDKTYYIVVRVGMGGIGMGGFPVVNVLRAFVFSAVNNTLVHTLSPLILYFNYKFFLKYFSA